jgi:hypothetical protein
MARSHQLDSESVPLNTDAQLDVLLGKMIQRLLKRIEDGTITSAEMAVARSLLRDNNIRVSPIPNPDVMPPNDAPTYGDDDE